MKYKTESTEYNTIRINYPPYYNNRCVICNSEVELKHPGNGKIVHTLKGKIYQVINYYVCINPKCHLHKTPFNPTSRYDYSNRYYGADVFKYVSEEFFMDQKPHQNLAYPTIPYLHRRCEGKHSHCL